MCRPLIYSKEQLRARARVRDRIWSGTEAGQAARKQSNAKHNAIHGEKIRPGSSLYDASYHEEYKRRARERRAKRIAADPKAAANLRQLRHHKAMANSSYRLNLAIGAAVWAGLRKNKMGHRWTKLVGYSCDALREHLEKQFTSGMTWDNYGKGGWVVDHIVPRCAFAFTEPDKNFLSCWSLENLRPLWEKDNLRKSAADRKQSLKSTC